MDGILTNGRARVWRDPYGSARATVPAPPYLTLINDSLGRTLAFDDCDPADLREMAVDLAAAAELIEQLPEDE